jgi:hypothetical protein
MGEARRRLGRIELAIRALFDAHPDEAFVTEEIAEHCYPAARPIERKHLVSVLRAARKLVRADPDWAWYISESHGGSLVFFNQASVQSEAMAHQVAGGRVAYHSAKRAYRAAIAEETWTRVMDRADALKAAQDALANPERRAEHERRAQYHLVMRDGDAETVALAQAKHEADRAVQMAQLAGFARAVRNPMSVLLDDQARWSGNMKELAEKARALIAQNDPDVVRAGLAEIAHALDAVGQEVGNPLKAALDAMTRGAPSQQCAA